MPNTRHRRFSVQNEIGGRHSLKMQIGLQTRPQDSDEKATVFSARSSKSRNKIFSSSKCSSNLDAVEGSVTSSIKGNAMDKDVTAMSSGILATNTEEIRFLNTDEPAGQRSQELDMASESQPKIRQTRASNIDRSSARRDKYPRQHRIKVRSPRRRPPILEHRNNRQSIGTAAIDWEQEVELIVVADLIEVNEEADRMSNQSLDDMCRICHSGESLASEMGQLVSACSCRGTVGRVHVKCLERWLTESGKSRCELCGTRYVTKRVHRYGVPRALLMWILSQNAKQLMVDSLGIMLMSPLAILAAWLTGRTLAGLMTQEPSSTPWPLASTFVLACMTLVCYYCWIVSAATRHALGWWIWYRSQYEVRLELEEIEE